MSPRIFNNYLKRIYMSLRNTLTNSNTVYMLVAKVLNCDDFLKDQHSSTTKIAACLA